MAVTIDQLLAAGKALLDALTAEQAAKTKREETAEIFTDLLASFRGGVTAADLASVTEQLQAHAAALDNIAQIGSD